MPKPKIEIFVTTSFIALHRWPQATGAVEFLKYPHRHLFKVRCEKVVNHDDRAIEFLGFKAHVDAFITSKLGDTDTGEWSCERWALVLLSTFKLSKCEVSEDGENGAIVTAA